MLDRSELTKFSNKKYRDGYLQTQTRGRIAYQIQALREKFGLSQIQFAERTGKKQSTISRLENTEYGRVSVQTLLDIACSLNVALIVRFASYPEFLRETQAMSIAALQPETIQETLQQKAVGVREPGPAEQYALRATEQEDRTKSQISALNDNMPMAETFDYRRAQQ